MGKSKSLEEAVKSKVSPLVEESIEKSLGLAIPKLESDITDQLANPTLNIYINFHDPFKIAKKKFKKEFFKQELQVHLGNVSQLAKVLDIDRRSIHRVIKDLDIDLNKVRKKDTEKEEEQRHLIDKSIRATLDQYKEVLHPQKMEKMYEEISTLSRNIVKFLPHKDLTWKEAEDEFEKEFFNHSLRESKGNISEAAKHIGIRAETLHRKLKQLGLK